MSVAPDSMAGGAGANFVGDNVLQSRPGRVRLLDCTLRDGGHINDGAFGRDAIKNVTRSLVEARADIVEIGFLWGEPCGEDVARFHTIADARKFLPADRGDTKFSLMADFIDLGHLEPCDGSIEFIRLSFKRERFGWALGTARMLMDKGYKVFINPVNCNVYTDEQYIAILREVNGLSPYGFSIVDTFGTMRVRDLTYRYGLVENNLDPGIAIGLHLHENLGLAYSLAQHFVQIASPVRDVVVDASLLGMGRVPGNLCIEQFMDHMNCEYGSGYRLEPAYDAIDDYIAPIKRETPWGYAIPYALSAKYGLHRTYAEYLVGKWKLYTSDIERILSRVGREKEELFDEGYIEGLYREYMSWPVDDGAAARELGVELEGRDILVIAPGASINEERGRVLRAASEGEPVVIGVHCAPDFVKVDYAFFANAKRYDALSGAQPRAREIVSSNLLRHHSPGNGALVFDYDSLCRAGDDYCDDSVVMCLQLLHRLGVRRLRVAGFDGFDGGRATFYIEGLARDGVDAGHTDRVLGVLGRRFSDMDIEFVTDSRYEGYKNGRDLK